MNHTSFRKSFSIVSTLALLASCSTGQEKNDKSMWSHQAFVKANDEQLLERQKSWEKFELQPGVANTPYFFVAHDALKRATQNRKIANENLANDKNKRPLQSVSDKGIYFLALFEQYQTMQGLTAGVKNIGSCPSFHSARLEYFPIRRSEVELKAPFQGINLNWKKIREEGSKNLAYFPELSLPLQTEAPFPSLVEALEDKTNTLTPQDLISKALYIQSEKIYNELTELCEFGATENSYIFENTLSYLKDNGSKLSFEEQMKIFMRLPVFTNLTMLKAIISTIGSDRAPASAPMRQVFEQEFLSRMRGTWAKEYWQNMVIERRKLL